jgi:hypothetical protein
MVASMSDVVPIESEGDFIQTWVGLAERLVAVDQTAGLGVEVLALGVVDDAGAVQCC